LIGESLGPPVGHGGDLGLHHLGVSQIDVGHVPQSLVEPQDQRYSVGYVDVGDLLVRDRLRVFQQGPEGAAVGDDEHSLAKSRGSIVTD